MTLIYQTDPNLPPNSLTVPGEAVRGLRGFASRWKLFVSDPEPMAVSSFLISKRTIQAAATDRNEGKPFSARQAQTLMKWLLEQEFIDVEKMEAEGSPSMFPSFSLRTPKPALGLKTPQIEN